MKWLLESVKSAVVPAEKQLRAAVAKRPGRPERFASLLTALLSVIAAIDVLLAAWSSDDDDEDPSPPPPPREEEPRQEEDPLPFEL